LFYLVRTEFVNAEALARFLKDRLSSDRTKEDWRLLLEGGWQRLMEMPLSSFLGVSCSRASSSVTVAASTSARCCNVAAAKNASLTCWRMA
jgi:hypothetical protein